MYIKLKNISKTYKNETVLKNINLELEKNKIYGFVGINGSGKSMLFKVIAGLVLPTTGEIYVNNQQLHKDISFPKSMGLLIEKPAFLPYLSAYENLKSLSNIQKKIEKNEIIEAISIVQLDPNSRKKVKNFSLGMKQRLGIAQAFMENPELIILDEPFNALDEEGVMLVRDIIIDLKKKGKTILLTSHNREDINLLCDEVYKLKAGKLIS